MKNVQLAIYLIGLGISLAFTLIVYAHANFTTKETVTRIEQYQKNKDDAIIKRLDKIDSKIDKILYGGKNE